MRSSLSSLLTGLLTGFSAGPRLSCAAALLAACTGGPQIDLIDSGVNTNPDLLNGSLDAQIRVGHFLAGLPPFDVCVKGPSDAAFRGPLVREQTQRVGGVPYTNVSGYVTLPASGYSVRAVPGSATNCNVSLASLPDLMLAPLSAGRRYTVVTAGELQKVKLSLTVIEDDLSTQGGQARLRFINASSDIASAELGTGAAGTYKALFTDATFGSFGRVSGGSGAYLTTGPQTSATFSVRETGASTELITVTNKVTVPAGSVATTFLIGLKGNVINPLELVVCDDGKPPQDGLAACVEVTPP